MILTNFEIEDMSGFRYAGQYYDLHNDYDFQGFKYLVSTQILEMEWLKFDRKNQGFTLNKLPSIQLLFTTVNFLKISERDNEMPLSEDRCLDVVGFLTQEDRDDMDSFSEKQTFENDDMILMFRGGQTFKINAYKVELIPKE